MPGLAGVVTCADHDFDILVECSQKLHQALDGKLIQAVVFQGRDFGLRYAEKYGGFALFQLASLEQFIDRQCQSRNSPCTATFRPTSLLNYGRLQ
jgi:hypothetical protein